jgi:fatty acid desaturase
VTPAELRRFIADHHRVRPEVYWVDLLGSAALGWGAFAVAGHTNGVPHVAATIFSALLLLRAVYFVHEISHLGRRAPRGFVTAWFLLAGGPLLVPALMIGGHRWHHDPKTYGTLRDPEYVPIARWSAWRLFVDLASMVLAAPVLIVRFGVLAPLSLTSRGLRKVVVERMSSLAMHPTYVRPFPPPPEHRRWIVQELIVCGYVWTALLTVPRAWIVLWATVATSALVFNQIRTYVAHAYESDGEPMTFDAQIADSITIRGTALLTDLFAPVGDRYHALHHRHPSMPYHALPAVHRALMESLPPDDPYRQTLRRGLIDALARFFQPHVTSRTPWQAEKLPCAARSASLSRGRRARRVHIGPTEPTRAEGGAASSAACHRSEGQRKKFWQRGGGCSVEHSACTERSSPPSPSS